MFTSPLARRVTSDEGAPLILECSWWALLILFWHRGTCPRTSTAARWATSASRRRSAEGSSARSTRPPISWRTTRWPWRRFRWVPQTWLYIAGNKVCNIYNWAQLDNFREVGETFGCHYLCEVSAASNFLPFKRSHPLISSPLNIPILLPHRYLTWWMPKLVRTASKRLTSWR